MFEKKFDYFVALYKDFLINIQRIKTTNVVQLHWKQIFEWTYNQ